MNKFFQNLIKGVYNITKSIITTIEIFTKQGIEISEKEVVETIREQDKYLKLKDKYKSIPDFLTIPDSFAIGTHRKLSNKYEVVFDVEMYDIDKNVYEKRFVSLLTDRLKSLGGLKKDFIDEFSEYYSALGKKIIKINLDSVYKRIE
ncbi:MAG: hypothetical protein QW754_05670 [Thermoplasmata archaeon]